MVITIFLCECVVEYGNLLGTADGTAINEIPPRSDTSSLP